MDCLVSVSWQLGRVVLGRLFVFVRFRGGDPSADVFHLLEWSVDGSAMSGKNDRGVVPCKSQAGGMASID